MIFLISCTSTLNQLTITETPMDVKSQISSIELDKSYYRPGKTVQIQVSILSEVGNPSKGSVVLTITNLSYVLIREDREVFLENGPQEIEFSYLPAEEAPRGYGIDVEIVSMDGELLDRATSAFDVLDNLSLIHISEPTRLGMISYA